jgi:hypothetical protein
MKSRLPAPYSLHALPMELPSTQPTQPKKQKPRSLEDILLSLGPITGILYKPFQTEPKQAARALLPTSFPLNPHLFDYFSLFFTCELLQTITANTNRYASIQKLHVLQERAQEWTDLLVEELYVFLGVIIYIGIHKEPQIEIYWNTDFNKGPLHSIASHIVTAPVPEDITT